MQDNHSGSRAFTPVKRTRNGNLGDKQKRYKRQVRKRIGVEHTFGACKLSKMIKYAVRRMREKARRTVVLISGMANLHIFTNFRSRARNHAARERSRARKRRAAAADARPHDARPARQKNLAAPLPRASCMHCTDQRCAPRCTSPATAKSAFYRLCMTTRNPTRVRGLRPRAARAAFCSG